METEPAFSKIQLKKASVVKRNIEEAEIEKVSLKHHEFERVPQEEEVIYLDIFFSAIILQNSNAN